MGNRMTKNQQGDPKGDALNSFFLALKTTTDPPETHIGETSLPVQGTSSLRQLNQGHRLSQVQTQASASVQEKPQLSYERPR